MEGIVPLLIAAVVFGFQAYANFQKEQKKARERRFSKPTENFDQDYREVYVPAGPVDHERQAEYVPYETPASPYGQYQGVLENFANEGRSKRKKSQKPSPGVKVQHGNTGNLQVTYLDDPHQGSGQGIGPGGTDAIDLRQAVIHSIILERPYK